MSEATIQGVVHLVEETKTYGQKGFRKRLVVLEQENGRFTNFIPVEFVQDNCDSADGLTKGDNVEITYKLNGRRWQKDAGSEVKFFLNAEALTFKKLSVPPQEPILLQRQTKSHPFTKTATSRFSFELKNRATFARPTFRLIEKPGANVSGFLI